MCSKGPDSSSLALRQKRGAWRVAPAFWEAQTCASNSICHEEPEWPFEMQALEIKGSDDWYGICLHLLSDSFLRQRPSSVNHLRVCDCHHCCAKYKCQRILSCRNKSDSCGMRVSDRSSFSVCPSLSMMKAATVNGKQLQELKSKPGVQIIFSYTDLAYPHIRSILAGSVKIISVKREKGLL